MKYKIDTVYCACHPETCSHWHYYIFAKQGNNWVRTSTGSDDYQRLEDIIADWENSTNVSIKTEVGTVSYSNSEDSRDMVFELVLKYFTDHQVFSGEVIRKGETSSAVALEMLAKIADDVVKFKIK